MILPVQGLRQHGGEWLIRVVFYLSLCFPFWGTGQEHFRSLPVNDGLLLFTHHSIGPANDAFLLIRLARDLAPHDLELGSGHSFREVLMLDTGILSSFFRSPGMVLLVLVSCFGLIIFGCRWVMRWGRARREPEERRSPGSQEERLPADIAHEFRRPLTNILELSRELSTTGLAPASEKLVRAIHQYSEQMLEQVDHLLTKEETEGRNVQSIPVQGAKEVNIPEQDEKLCHIAQPPDFWLELEALAHTTDPLLPKILAEIEANAGNHEFTVADLCQAMAMSKSHLHRRLKALTGQSAIRLIRSVRLRKACRMLQDNGLNISEVAFRTGFSDPAYFSRLFNQELGMSPSEYRDLGEKE